MTQTTEPENRLMEHLLSHGVTRPQDAALTIAGHALTWGALRARVLGAAGALDRMVPSGGRVALLGDVSPELVVAYLGIVASGRCAVPLQTSAHPDALLGMLGDCDASALLADKDYIARLGDRLPRDLQIHDLATLEAEDAGEVRTQAPEDAFNIIYSSGTTGQPKGIVQSHRMRYRQSSRSAFGLSAQSRLLLATPLYSNTTLMPMLATLYHGGQVVMMPKFDAGGYLELAESLRATHTMLVPVQYQRILAHESFAARDLSSFQLKQSTGAPLPPEDKLTIARAWPGRFLEVYGLTEGGCTCILDVGAHPDKARTVGQPARGNDIRIIDEAGRDVPVGERGEIVGRSPMMMTEYFRKPEITEAFLWRDSSGTVYHRTGDIGLFDEDGFLTLVDRKKDVIISGGFNIYASDLEEALLAHPDVTEASVIAFPSAKWGETPLGIIAVRGAVEAQDVLEWANARLGKMQRLSAVKVVDALPRNAVGKVLKQDLKSRYGKETA